MRRVAIMRQRPPTSTDVPPLRPLRSSQTQLSARPLVGANSSTPSGLEQYNTVIVRMSPAVSSTSQRHGHVEGRRPKPFARLNLDCDLCANGASHCSYGSYV